MQSNFERALARVLVYEGGLAHIPGDPGGLTNKGITEATYTNWLYRQRLPPMSVANITNQQVYSIYKADYWDRIRGDDLPTGVDFCIFDAAVNSGVSAAVSWAQAVLGITIDGDLGPATERHLGSIGADTFVREYCARRLGSLKRLRTWGEFGRGWSARVANVQKTCIAWVESQGAVHGPDPIQVAPLGGQNKADIGTIPVSRVGSIVTQGGVVAGGVVAATAQAGQSLSTVSTDGPFEFVKYVVGGLTVVGAIAGLIVLVSHKWNDDAANSVATAKVDLNADGTSIPVPISAALAQVVPPAPAIHPGVEATLVKLNG